MNCFEKWKRNLFRQAQGCFSQINITAALIGGGVLLLAGILVRAICGSPYGSVVMIQFGDVIPPAWIMTLLWMIWYFVLGCIFGGIMFSNRCCGVISIRTIEKYRGGMFFLAMIFFGFLWYPLFFVAARVFLSAAFALFILLLCILTGASFFKVSRVAGTVLFVHALFLIWLLILNVRVLFFG